MQTEFTAINGTAETDDMIRAKRSLPGLLIYITHLKQTVCVLTPTSHHRPDGADKVHKLHFDAWFITKTSNTLVHSPAN